MSARAPFQVLGIPFLALRWWVDEHQASTDGAPDPDDLDLEDPDPLRTALVRIIDVLDAADQLVAGGW